MSDTLKRITPEEVVAAYRKTGLKPAREMYITDDGLCGCGMGVYAIACLGCKPCFGAIDDALNDAGLAIQYQNGFATGFDGCLHAEFECTSDREYNFGFVDGVAAWKAVSKEIEIA